MERFQGTMGSFFGKPDISSAMMTSDETDFHFEYSVLLSLGSRAHMGPIGLLWLSSQAMFGSLVVILVKIVPGQILVAAAGITNCIAYVITAYLGKLTGRPKNCFFVP